MTFPKSLAMFVLAFGVLPSVWGKNLRVVSLTKDTPTTVDSESKFIQDSEDPGPLSLLAQSSPALGSSFKESFLTWMGSLNADLPATTHVESVTSDVGDSDPLAEKPAALSEPNIGKGPLLNATSVKSKSIRGDSGPLLPSASTEEQRLSSLELLINSRSDSMGENDPLPPSDEDLPADTAIAVGTENRRLFNLQMAEAAKQASQVSHLLIDNGYWGDWRGFRGHNPPYYACGAQMRFEDSQGGGDDTAANGLKLLFCHWDNWNSQKWVSIHDGYWGKWKSQQRCSHGKFIDGAEVRIEKQQGGGDDTGLNGLRIHCVDKNGNRGETIRVYDGLWGNWRGMKTKNGWMVSQADMRIEKTQGGGDDTAWNGLKFLMRPRPTPRPTQSPTPRPTPAPTQPPTCPKGYIKNTGDKPGFGDLGSFERRCNLNNVRFPPNKQNYKDYIYCSVAHTPSPTPRPTASPTPQPTYAKRKGQSCNVNEPCEPGLGCDTYIGKCVKIPAGEGESCRQYSCEPELDCARDTTATCTRPELTDPLKNATKRLDCKKKDNVFCSPQLEKCYCLDPTFSGSYEAGTLACKQSGGEIVSILSKFENDAIMAKKDWWSNLLKTGDAKDLRSKGVWIGLVERFGSYGLAWFTGEDMVYKTPLDASYNPKQEDIEKGCFVLTRHGRWKPERCNPQFKSEKASVLCQARNSFSKKLQGAFFDVFPKGLVFVLKYSDRTYITSDFKDKQIKADKLISMRGKPGGADRFKFVADESKSGVMIQVATWDKMKEPPVPFFEEENGVFIVMEYKDNLSADKDEFKEIPALGDRAKATVFNIVSRSSPDGPPFGLKVKYLPQVFLTVDALGQVRFKRCPNDVSSCYTVDFLGAPNQYELIVTLDEIDIAKHLKGGRTEYAVAAQRIIETEVEGTVTIELSSEQSEERSVTTTVEQMKERSQSATDTEGGDKSTETSKTQTEEESLEKGKTETTTETHEAGAEVSGGAFGVSASASYSYSNEHSTETSQTETSTSTFEQGLTQTSSANWEASLESSEGWSSTATDESNLVQTKTVTITDTLEVEAKPGIKYTAQLIVASKHIKGLVVPATSRLYADGIVVATSRISVTVDTVAISSGSIKLEKLGEPIKEPARLEDIGSISEDEENWSRNHEFDESPDDESASSESGSEEEESASSESEEEEFEISESESESASSESESEEEEASASSESESREDDFFAGYDEDTTSGEEVESVEEESTSEEEDDFFAGYDDDTTE